MKNAIVPIAVIAIILCGYLMISANQTVNKIQETLDLERFQRMESEEKILAKDSRIKALERELEGARSKVSKIQNILQEGEGAKETLESQIEKMRQENLMLRQKVENLGAVQPQPVEATQ